MTQKTRGSVVIVSPVSKADLFGTDRSLDCLLSRKVFFFERENNLEFNLCASAMRIVELADNRKSREKRVGGEKSPSVEILPRLSFCRSIHFQFKRISDPLFFSYVRGHKKSFRARKISPFFPLNTMSRKMALCRWLFIFFGGRKILAEEGHKTRAFTTEEIDPSHFGFCHSIPTYQELD